VFLNAFRIRLALMGAGILTLVIYLAMGGRLGPSKDGVVMIEFGMYPDEFTGAVVQVDGQPLGELKPISAQYRNAFRIKPGVHELGLETRRAMKGRYPFEIKTGQTVMLILNFGETVGGGGKLEPVVTFDG